MKPNPFTTLSLTFGSEPQDLMIGDDLEDQDHEAVGLELDHDH